MVRHLVLLFAAAAALASETPRIEAGKAEPPPEWALLQRQILDKSWPAAKEFVARYTLEDGTLIWRKEWPGMDGSDDGYESFYNFPLFYALGGPAEANTLSRSLWDAVTRQFTGYGTVYKEFDGYYDWMHHGESYVNFYFFGLADPYDAKFRERALRFAGLYMNEVPEAQNWDPANKRIRSPITGSKGPRFVNSAEDWVTHRDVLKDYPLPYDDIPNVRESKAWVDDKLFPYILETMNKRMMSADVPLNLTATSMMLNAYMYTGEEKYKRWVLDYTAAWMDRVKQNGGIIPDNIGPNGKIGETMDGKWYGGYYGWRWPHGLFNQLESTTIAGSNALLLTGDTKWLDLPRSQVDVAEKFSKVENGRRMVAHRHSEKGWYDYRPIEAQYPVYVWYLSQNAEDWKRIERLAPEFTGGQFRYRKAKGDDKNEAPWVAFLQGKNAQWPAQMLRATWGETLRRLEVIRKDTTVPEDMNVHHWQQRNPIVLEGLVQQMLGAPNHIYHGGLLHARLRYFDPAGRRPGVPPDVAALVERVTDREVGVQLVNLHPSETREVTVQAGMFGEHRFTVATKDGEVTNVNGKLLTVRVLPGSTARLTLGMERWVNQPAYAFPWR
jgi:hypothetical protein